MRFIITGGLGFVGYNLINEIAINSNTEIIVLHLPNEDKSIIQHKNVKFVQGNILDHKLLNSLIQKDDIVIHLAGIIDIAKGNEDNVMLINYEGTKIISDICFNKNATLIYVSTVHALKPPLKGKIDENCPLNVDAKRGIYEESKSKATQHIYSLINKGLDARIIFPSAITGPNDYKYGQISQAVNMLVKGNMPFYMKGGYSFVDVRDVCKAIHKVAINGKKGDKYIVSNSYISIKQLMKLVDQIENKKRFRIYIPIFLIRLAVPLLTIHAKRNNKKPIFTKTMLDTVLSNGEFDNRKMINDLDVKPCDLKITIEDTINFLKENIKS